MNRAIAAAALLLLAVASAVGSAWSLLRFSPRGWQQTALAVGVAGGCVAAVACGLYLIGLRNRRQRDALNLDVYLPVLRRPSPGQTRPPGLWGRLRNMLPAGFRSNHQTKQRGAVRRGLRKIGGSWLQSPLRRVIQATCFVAFCGLFLWVCWPYDARPAGPGKSSDGWRLQGIDPDGITFRLHRSDAGGQVGGTSTGDASTRSDWPGDDEAVYLSSGDAAGPTFLSPGRVISRSRSGDEETAAIALTEPPSPEQLDAALTGAGAWRMAQSPPDAWPDHYAENFARKEVLPADAFLAIDPLVSLSTAIASRSWVWSLTSAAVLLTVCLLIPRGFCGYLCPLGTLIDLFDWSIGRRVTRFRVGGDGWWVHIKYYLLLGVLVSALFGVLVSGYVAAIPVITRGFLLVLEPLQSGTLRGWQYLPPWHAGHVVSLVLFVGVLSLGLLQPRFWCKYVCPSGATFSLGNLFRVSERKVESSCIGCNKCVEVCPFDAIKPDFTTRGTDCTQCQTCGGVCPTHAIKFVERWNRVELKLADDPPTNETRLGRRGFLSLAAGTSAAIVGGGLAATTQSVGGAAGEEGGYRPVRPPGSVPEPEFLDMCIRCGECFKVCPNNVLQLEGFQQGFAGLWTPLANADWAGCDPSCNACGQVCPTGAIRQLPLEEKRVARMGLAVLNERTCLPLAGREACQLCVDECAAAGYHAIEFLQVHTQVDSQGEPIPGSGFLAPQVLADKCVGCGLCQTRCYSINAKSKRLLSESAIIVQAGPGKEDRLMDGSYLELRRRERAAAGESESLDDFFVPEAIEAADSPEAIAPPEAIDQPAAAAPRPIDDADPFGLGG